MYKRQQLFFLFYGIGRLKEILDIIRQMESYIKIRPVYLVTLLKMTGVTYAAEFASGICKDAGYGALGKQIEIFGKLTILAVSIDVYKRQESFRENSMFFDYSSGNRFSSIMATASQMQSGHARRTFPVSTPFNSRHTMVEFFSLKAAMQALAAL